MQAPTGFPHEAHATELSTRPFTEGLAKGGQAGGEGALLEGLRRLCEGGPWIYAALWQHRNGGSLPCQADSKAGVFYHYSERQSGKLACTLFHSQMPAAGARRPVDYEALSLALARLQMLEFENGEGILGEAAVSSEGDRWLSTSPSGYRVRPPVATGSTDKADEHWRAQFAAGLETALLTSFEGCLLQLGSIEKLQEDPAIAVQARTAFLPFVAAALPSPLEFPNPHGRNHPSAPEPFNELRYPFNYFPPRSPEAFPPQSFETLPPRGFDSFPQALHEPWAPHVRHAFPPPNPFVPSKHSSKVGRGGRSFKGGSLSVLPVMSRSASGQYLDRPTPPYHSRPSVLPFSSPPPNARPPWNAPPGQNPWPTFYERLLERPGQDCPLIPAAVPGASQFDLNAPSPSPAQWFSETQQSAETSSYGGFPCGAGETISQFAKMGSEVQQRGNEFGVSAGPCASEQASDLFGRLESRDPGTMPWDRAPLEARACYGDRMFETGATGFGESEAGFGGVSEAGFETIRNPQLGSETLEDWGSREAAFRLQESFLRLREQLGQATTERQPFLSLGPGNGSKFGHGNGRHLPDLEHDGLSRTMELDAADLRFAWAADERGRQRPTPHQQMGRAEETISYEGGISYEEIYTPRAHAERAAHEEGESSPFPHSYSMCRDSEGRPERAGLKGGFSSRGSEGGGRRVGPGGSLSYASGLARAWKGDPATPSKRLAGGALAGMETIMENEVIVLRPWDKGRQAWYTNLEALRALVPNTAQLKLEDLLDRVAKHILALRAQITSKGNTRGREDAFRAYTDLSWSVSSGKTLVVEELSSARLVLLEAYCDSEARVPQLASTLKVEGREVCFMLAEAIGKATRARFLVKVKDGISTADLLTCLVGR